MARDRVVRVPTRVKLSLSSPQLQVRLMPLNAYDTRLTLALASRDASASAAMARWSDCGRMQSLTSTRVTLIPSIRYNTNCELGELTPGIRGHIQYLLHLTGN